jgi:PhnB protein
MPSEAHTRIPFVFLEFLPKGEPECNTKPCSLLAWTARLFCGTISPFMKPKVHHIPTGHPALTPYLIVNDAARAIKFYQQVFGAQQTACMASPDGKVAHAEIKIGDSVVMLADEFPGFISRSPASYGGTPVTLCLYVEDCDVVMGKAIELGAKMIRPLRDQFYGDRSGTLTDPFGHIWTVATHKEDLTMDEIQKRASAAFGSK